jgi:hypothetical protein
VQPEADPAVEEPGSRAAPPRVPLLRRLNRRARAFARFALLRINQYRAALTFAGVLAAVGVLMFSPLLLDDLIFKTSYLLRPSPDAVTIEVPAIVSEQPRIAVLSGALSVPSALSGKARTGEALATLIKGGSARLALSSPVIELELSPQLGAGFGTDEQPSTAASPLLTALEDATFESLTIHRGTVLLKSAGGRIDTLTDVTAELGVKRKTAVRIKGSATYNGETVAFDATFGARIGRRGSSRLPMKATLRSGPLQVALDGRLDVGNGLQLSAQVADIEVANVRTLARWLGHAWPSGAGLKDFSAHGQLEWSGQTISFPKAVFKIDGNEANGTAALTFGGVRPAFAGTFACQTIDLAPYFPEPLATAAALLPQLKATRDLTLPMMGTIDADVRLSTDAVVLGPWQAGRSAASIALREGQLLANLAELTLPGGGTATAEMAIQGSPTIPNYTVHGRIDAVELASLTAGLIGAPIVRGVGGVVVDLRASGGAGIDVLSRLSGRIDVTLPDGGAAGCTMKDLAAVAQSGADPIPDQLCRTATSLQPAKATISLTNGIVTAGSVGAAAGADQLRLSGTVDLVTRIMDLTVAATPLQRADPAVSSTAVEPAPREVITIRGRPEALDILLKEQ